VRNAIPLRTGGVRTDQIDGAEQKAVVVAIVLTSVFFYIQEWGRKGRTYCQPVSLMDVALSENELHKLKLKFFNPAYARVFVKANSNLIRLGVLKVEVQG
jgi:hypothetical protein